MFFSNNQFDQEPEGDELPEEAGMKRFWQIILDHCVAIVKLNLLFLVSSLLVVTIPPALFATLQVVHNMVRDEPVKCWRDYKAAFKSDWKRGYCAFFATILPILVGGYGTFFYLRNMGQNYLLIVPFALCACMFWIITLASTYLYGLMTAGMPWKEAVRTALFLALAKPLRAFLAALCWYGLPAAAILFFPLSGAYLLLIGITLPLLLGSFYTRTVLKQFCSGPEEYSQDT